MMKKMLLASALLCAALGAASAQEGASGGTRFSTGYVLTHYEGVTINEYGKLVGATRLIRNLSTSIEERQVYGSLNGDERVNTASELLAMASVLGIQDVKKEDALKLYAEIAMEGAANSFLGVTGTTHSQVLERLRGKYNFTQAEIAGAIRATVAAVVEEKLNESRNGYVPAEVYAQWKKVGAGDAQALLVDAITRFYLEPTQANFRGLVEIYARQYELTLNDDLFARTGEDTFTSILLALNASLKEKVVLTGLGLNVEVARLDPRYKVFSTPYATGGGNSGNR
jgi:opacity protein-like surface antigen